MSKVKNKKKRNRIIFRSIVLAIMALALVYALYSHFTSDVSSVKAGDIAPPFELDQINKNNDLDKIILKDYRGKGVMLNFWATYCDPCKAEMPYMEELYPKYQKKGVEIIAVNLDATKLVVNRFIDEYGITFPIPFDNKGSIRELYDIVPIPSTFFINKDGEVVRAVNGSLSLDSLEKYLQEIEPNKEK